MNVPVIDGVEYDKEFVSALKASCVVFRDAALENNRFDWAVTLSHVIACLSILIEELPR